MRALRTILSAAVAVALVVPARAGAAATAGSENPPGPFEVMPWIFNERVKVIAIQRVYLSAALGLPDEFADELEQRTTRELQRAGLRVVDSSVFDEIWIELARKVDGVFDAQTGERDPERYRAVREHTLNELSRLHDVDATLEIRAFINRQTTPRYEINGEELVWSGRPLLDIAGFWPSFGTPQASEIMVLAIRVRDLTDRLLYEYAPFVAWTRIYLLQSYQERRIRDAPLIGDQIERALLVSLYSLTEGQWPLEDPPNPGWVTRSSQPTN